MGRLVGKPAKCADEPDRLDLYARAAVKTTARSKAVARMDASESENVDR
jgi:hypothetical protein